MDITGLLVLAADTMLVPVEQLSAELRRQVKHSEGDYAIGSPNSRIATRIVDAGSAKLLEQFRQPVTVVDAVIRNCSLTDEDPESTIDAAFPMLEQLLQSRILVPAGAPETESLKPLLEVGSLFAGNEVLKCLQSLHDTDLYSLRTPSGEPVALKIVRATAGQEVERELAREAFLLKRLDAKVSPLLLADNSEAGLHYLILSWCGNSDCSLAAESVRASGDTSALLRLCVSILDAYSHLHAQGVIHGDVHQRNILVDEEGVVRIVDFGLARLTGVESEFSYSKRAGVAYFFEPEYAAPVRAGRTPPQSSPLSEQYSLASLLYFLITGKHSIDFSLEKQEMLRQIIEEAPLPFKRHGRQPWPSVEAVLAVALAKDPAARYASVSGFSLALQSAGTQDAPDQPSASHPVALEMLAEALKRFDIHAPHLRSGIVSSPGTSVMYGSAGVAYALRNIACSLRDARILSMSDVWGQRSVREIHGPNAWFCPEIGITPEVVGHVSPYHSEAGVHLVNALIAHAADDIATQAKSIHRFITASSKPCVNLDLAFGRSGTLLAASQLLATLRRQPESNAEALRNFGDNTLAYIWQHLDAYDPIADCREIQHTGAAHGWAGILYATLCWCRVANYQLPPNLADRLSQLAALKRDFGRRTSWDMDTSGIPKETANALAGSWCNGSAGQVYLWLAAHAALNEQKYLSIAEGAARYAAGFNGRNGSLCCGFAGQAYALLALYRHNGEKAWLTGARALAEKAAHMYRNSAPQQNTLHAPVHSLYKGELGVAVLAANLEDTDNAAFPAFECVEF